MLQYNNNLPKEIINIILEYDGRIRYRNGKYIEQINNEDKIYECIKEKIQKDIKLVTTIHLHAEVSNFYYNWAIENNISMDQFDWHFRYGICPHVELKILKDKTRYVMYFEFNYRLNSISKICFYKSIKETWQHKCKVNVNQISYILFDTGIFNEKYIFKSEYICN
jgi:hypothetical protein